MVNKFLKHLYATTDIRKKTVRFQLDRGAFCNVISEETFKSCSISLNLEETEQVISMYNQTTLRPVGQCTLELHNHKTDKPYCTESVVLKEQRPPLRANLIQVRFKNILLPASRPDKEPLRIKQPIDQFPNVF